MFYIILAAHSQGVEVESALSCHAKCLFPFWEYQNRSPVRLVTHNFVHYCGRYLWFPWNLIVPAWFVHTQLSKVEQFIHVWLSFFPISSEHKLKGKTRYGWPPLKGRKVACFIKSNKCFQNHKASELNYRAFPFSKGSLFNHFMKKALLTSLNRIYYWWYFGWTLLITILN